MWAIDVGTTNTGVARWDPGAGQPKLVALPDICRAPSSEDPLEAPLLVPSATEARAHLDFWSRLGSVGVLRRNAFLGSLGTREAITRQARLMSSIKDGAMKGLKIYGLRPDTPLKALGFYNGDAIVAVDGQTLSDASAWDPAITAAVVDNDVTLDIVRKRQPLTLVFHLVDGPATPPTPPIAPVPPMPPTGP